MVSRYMPMMAVKLKDNTLIPMWDERIEYVKSEDYGKIIQVKGVYGRFELIECLYDLKTKTISIGVELDYYPEADKFKVGDTIYYEVERAYKCLKEATIKEIVFTEFELSIMKGKKLTAWMLKDVKVEISPDMLYSVKSWKPFYIMEDGTKIEWEHQMYRKAQ
jgi:hypothetical protein